MRRFLRITSLTLTLLLFLLLALFFWVQQQIKQLPLLQLDYQIHSIGWRQLQLDHLQFELQSQQQPLQVKAQHLELSWRWKSFRPHLHSLVLQQLNVKVAELPQTETTTTPQTSWQLPEQWSWPDWLPALSRINELQLNLPCGNQRCHYQGHVWLEQSEQLTAELLLSPVSSTDIPPQLLLQLSYQLEQQWPQLELALAIDELLQVQLSSALTTTAAESSLPSWQGDLNLTLAPPPPWILTQLELWEQQLPELWLEQFKQPVTASSEWKFAVPDELDQQFWQQLTGDWQLQLSSPSPLYLPRVGLLSAELQANAHFEQGQLAPFRIAAGGQLTALELPAELLETGYKASDLHWSLSSQHSDALSLSALPLQFRLSSTDQQQQLLAKFKLDLLAQTAMIDQLDVQLAQSALRSGDWQLSKVQLQASLAGLVTPTSLQLRDKKPVQLSAAANNTALELQIPALSIKLDELQLQSSQIDSQAGSHAFSTALAIQMGQLKHPVVKPLKWTWQGTVAATMDESWQLNSKGLLNASSGFEVNHRLDLNPTELQLHWQLTDIFMLAGNTLATTFTDWPELLTLQRGRIKHQGQLLFTLENSSYQLASTTELIDLSGFYDTTLFRGLSSQLQLDADPQQLQFLLPALKLEQIEQGLVAGPLHLTADYQAYWDAPLAGQLSLHDNQLNVFHGTVSLPQQRYDLSQDEWLLPLQLKKLELQQLLTQHPTSDLTGQGWFSGEIPLIISARGMEVSQGRLQAEAPGGRLNYRSPKAQGIAASNPSMNMIIAALDDFHYSVLNSDVSYSPDGQLLLALRLEGRNPALESGRPVHFTITLEENLPALITSLQLTNQLNEVIQQRVQQRLQTPRKP